MTNTFSNGFALIVGISHYQTIRSLPPSVSDDALDIQALLTQPAYCGYPAEQVRLITDAAATAVNLRSQLEWLATAAGSEDTVIIYFSGHGGQLNTGDLSENYLLLHDTDLTQLESSAISGREFTQHLRKIQAKRLLVLFDCCHAGGIGEAKDTAYPTYKSGLSENLYDALKQGAGRAIIASSRSDEKSWVLDNMRNSLFTHYLLQALRGESPTQGDGLIRLFDLFDYVSEHVSSKKSVQHPLLKAEIENNFPIALNLGGQRSSNRPGNKPPPLTIENPVNIPLSLAEEAVLTNMFRSYERLVIKKEFGGGFSGGRVFLVRPIDHEGADLPAIIKTGPITLIKQEWEAYEKYIRNKLPNVAQIDGTLVASDDETWACLRYPLVGNGRFHTESLRQYCQHAANEHISYVLQQRLFTSLSALWKQHKLSYEFQLQTSYDRLLPVNLVLSEISLTPDTSLPTLTPATLFQQTFSPGIRLNIAGFVIEEIEGDQVTLNLPTQINATIQPAFRLRLSGISDPATLQQHVARNQGIVGRIQETRLSRLQSEAQRAFRSTIDVQSDEIEFADGVVLPNPLNRLERILQGTVDVNLAFIHGDLNLENVLVEYDQVNQNIHLIDFASARTDHVLHDLLRLETGFWLYAIPEALLTAKLPLSTLHAFATTLHQAVQNPTIPNPIPALDRPYHALLAIRQQASSLLADQGNWTEYYQGLTLYLLGALKFKNLDKLATKPLPKQAAFFVAAMAQQLLAIPTALTPAMLPPKANKEVPPPFHPVPPPQIGDSNKKIMNELANLSNYQLMTLMNKKLSISDLQDICVILELDYENVSGSSKKDKIRELILYQERRDAMPQLFEAMLEIRPDIAET